MKYSLKNVLSIELVWYCILPLWCIVESESVNALVYDLTGIDLAVTTKDDLHKEMRDEALSTISFTPEPKEEEEEEKVSYFRQAYRDGEGQGKVITLGRLIGTGKVRARSLLWAGS